MKWPQIHKHIIRVFTAISLLALTICGVVIFCKYRLSSDTPPLSFADALYVTNKDITKVYGPGTTVQQNILAQFQTQNDISEMKLPQPVLYRMGIPPDESNEGILMLYFSPAHPEMAKQLRQK
jgi:hypothetical protein